MWDDDNLKQNQSILANQHRESEMQGKCIYEGFRTYDRDRRFDAGSGLSYTLHFRIRVCACSFLVLAEQRMAPKFSRNSLAGRTVKRYIEGVTMV